MRLVTTSSPTRGEQGSISVDGMRVVEPLGVISRRSSASLRADGNYYQAIEVGRR